MKYLNFSLLVMLNLVLSASALSASPTIESGKFKVDGYQLEYSCAGNASPSVFLESPSGISSRDAFENIYLKIAENNRVCFYERLGFGDSDKVPDGFNQTVKDYSHELEHLVKLKAPHSRIILVGYSFGGFIARYFTSKNPDVVAAILLIDAAHENWIQDMKTGMSGEDWDKMQSILDWFQSNLGHNYWDSQFEIAKTNLPEELKIKIISRGLPHETIRQAGVSEDGIRIYNALHDKYQIAQLDLSNNTSRVVAKNSGHLIVDSEPELVLEQLRLLLK